MQATAIERRLIELETKCAYQDDALQVLSGEVARQRRDIEQLEQRCRDLQQRLVSQADPTFIDSARDEIPPHW
ncbi:MAG: hypothetical protein NVS9B10_19940 [Nevskia sp.]